MIVFYHPADLSPVHIVTVYADQYRKFIEANPQQWPFLVIEGENLRIEEVEVLPEGQWRRRLPMQIVAPSSAVVNEEFEITGVPEGMTIEVDGAAVGEMDASGSLTLSMGTPAFYQVRFSGPAYITKEITIEAVPAT